MPRMVFEATAQDRVASCLRTCQSVMNEANRPSRLQPGEVLLEFDPALNARPIRPVWSRALSNMCCHEVSSVSGSSACWPTAAGPLCSHSPASCSPWCRHRGSLPHKRPRPTSLGDAPSVLPRCRSGLNLRRPNSLSNAAISTAPRKPPATFRRKDVPPHAAAAVCPRSQNQVQIPFCCRASTPADRRSDLCACFVAAPRPSP